MKALVADLATAELIRESQYTLLINNAGTATHGDFHSIPLDAALATLDLNCRAVLTLAHAFLAKAGTGQHSGKCLVDPGPHPETGDERLQRLQSFRRIALRRAVA